MAQILVPFSLLLHALSTAIFIGFYFVMSTIILPTLSQKGEIGLQAMSEISKRSRLWLYISFGILGLTGIYLTIVDPKYAGLGQFDSTWSFLMLAKHIIIVLMIGLGCWFNAIRRVGPSMLSTSNAAAGLIRFKKYNNWMSVCGALVLILTTIAQIK
jgi:uncharacterized membrane protein